MGLPSPIPGTTTPNSNSESGTITPSNKSPQAAQAAAQNVPQGRATTGGASVIAGAGSSARRIQNGSIGKPYGRKG